MKNFFLPFGWCTIAICFTACEDHRNSPNASFPERINFVAQRQYPEGIAYSGQLEKFVISSVTQGKIGTVGTDGRYADLLSDPGLISVNGIKVAGDRLLATNNDQGASDKSTPQTTRQTAELFVFNLTTRQLERRVDLDDLLPAADPNFANDLALAPNSTVYVTDSFSPVIYQVTGSGQASILVRDDVRFSSPTFGLNGIVYHPNGYLIVANTGQGKLYKVDIQNGNAVTEITGTGALPGDGLTLLNGDLYVVTGGSRVAQVRSTDNWQTAQIVKFDASGYSQATTNVAVNNQIFTINARIGEIGAAMGDRSKLQSSEYSIQRFR
jgi:sugar lactone lactonase YvrE